MLGQALNLSGWTISFVTVHPIVLPIVNLVLLHSTTTVDTVKMWLWDVVSKYYVV